MRVIPLLMVAAACADPAPPPAEDTGSGHGTIGTTITSVYGACSPDYADGTTLEDLATVELVGYGASDVTVPDLDAQILDSQEAAEAWIASTGYTADLSGVDFATQVVVAGWYWKAEGCGAVDAALTVRTDGDDLRATWEVADHGASCQTMCQTGYASWDVRVAPRPAGEATACGYLFSTCG